MSIAPAGLLDDLRGAGPVETDPDVLEAYRRDHAAPGLLEVGMPAALVRPRTTGEVQAAVRAAARHGVPVVPRGAGLRAVGRRQRDRRLPRRLARADDLDPRRRRRRPHRDRPGRGRQRGRSAAAAADARLWYSPDPASWEFSTIGGNVATNAGGLCCVKYGVTRDSLLGLEVVLADGRAVRLGRRTRKGVAGYDLVGLLCGSEGTLGIVTEATVRLRPPPAAAATLAASFPALRGAGDAIARIAREQRPVAARADGPADDPRGRGVPAAGARSRRRGDGLRARGRRRRASRSRRSPRWRGSARSPAPTSSCTSDEEAEGRMLMAARRLAFTALEHRGATLLDDVGVPLGAIPALLDGVARIADEHGVLIGTFGHAGDGNMHPTVVYDASDPGEVERARGAFEAILRAGAHARRHDHGRARRRAAQAPVPGAASSATRIDLHRAIKAALDPAGVFNPGKAV